MEFHDFVAEALPTTQLVNCTVYRPEMYDFIAFKTQDVSQKCTKSFCSFMVSTLLNLSNVKHNPTVTKLSYFITLSQLYFNVKGNDIAGVKTQRLIKFTFLYIWDIPSTSIHSQVSRQQ